MTLIRFQVFTFLLLMTSVYGLPGGHEKYRYYKTEGWLESDHSGSGFQLVDDYQRPNIWVRIFRYDTAVSQVIGLPNNETAGEDIQWTDSDFDDSNPKMRGGDYYRLLQISDFEEPLAEIDSNGGCSGSGRCYGDWINNERLWNYQIKDYVGKNGQSFLKPEERMNGQKRTRYRFDIFVEDNTPFWFKDSDGAYDLGKIPAEGGYDLNHTNADDPTANVMYYPVEQVVFRICKKSKLMALPSDEAPAEQWNAYMADTNWAEYHVHKQNDDMIVSKAPLQSRHVNGRLVFNFTIYHSFQDASEYVIQLIAEDHSANRRILHIPMVIEGLKGLELKDQASEMKKFD